MNKVEFQELVWQKGRELFRDMPWRRDTRPYYILVSELMLQQTQVERVKPKFAAFITRFPDIATLARAPLSDVLQLWSGLGYNRRAKYLHEAAKTIASQFHGQFPTDMATLLSLPGIGPGTAGALSAYAFNLPAVFIETNVRTVYFHHFFESGEPVHDSQLKDLIEQTIDHDHPREFYWALMDYGSWLKQRKMGHLQQSRHYKKQSKLEGSVRQVRGQIIRLLTEGDMTIAELKDRLTADKRFDEALYGLVRDGLILHTNNRIHLTK